MSNEVSALVQKRLIGSATKKSVLLYLADRASDDGTGIWTSKAHISDDTELSKRSVQNSMTDFERDGIIKKSGTKSCQNGFTFEYSIDIEAVKRLKSTRKDTLLTGAGGAPQDVQVVHGVQVVHLTGAGGAPQDVQVVHPNHPLTIPEPSKEKEEGKPSSKKRGTRLADDWVLPREWEAWALTEKWHEDVIRNEAEKFKDYWHSKAGASAVKLDWQATWRNWMRNSKQPKSGNSSDVDFWTGGKVYS